MSEAYQRKLQADLQVEAAAALTQIEVNISDGSQIEVKCGCEQPYMELYTASNRKEYIICRSFFEGGCKTVIRSAVMDEDKVENSTIRATSQIINDEVRL